MSLFRKKILLRSCGVFSVMIACVAFGPAAALGQADAPAPRDHFAAGQAALAREKYEEAAAELKQIPPGHPQYGRGMALLAYDVYTVGLNRAKEGLPYAKLALDAAPDEPDVARAFVKTYIFSGVLFEAGDIARERPKSVAPEHAFIVTKPNFGDTSKKFPRAALEADLDYLEHILGKCFAYLELRQVDYRGALDAIRLSLDDETPVNTFEICVAKLISLFGDGHASMFHNAGEFLPAGFAPFIAESDHGRIYLIAPSGSDYLDPAHPYVTAIDGRPIADWMKAAGYLVVKESPQWHLRGALRMMTAINYLRAELQLPVQDTITLSLESKDRTSSVETRLGMRRKPVPRPTFPRGETRLIDGEVGYIRLSSMTSNGREMDELQNWMAKFRTTRGLILDVRGNTGGTKDILHTLFPYFVKPGEPMRLVEATCYRLPLPMPRPVSGGFSASSTSGQALGSHFWKTEEERRQVAAFIEQFHPEWQPPSGKFSEWHVMGLDAKSNPNAYYYGKPIIVLQDSLTFSAGDIFVGAFEGHPNTTRIGVVTAGGNGQMEGYRLPNTGLGVVLCWSAKFRGNGKLYDTKGIAPDIEMAATPEDIFGASDSVLDAAVQRLKKGK